MGLLLLLCWLSLSTFFAFNMAEETKRCIITGLPGSGKSALINIQMRLRVDRCSKGSGKIRNDLSWIFLKNTSINSSELIFSLRFAGLGSILRIALKGNAGVNPEQSPLL